MKKQNNNRLIEVYRNNLFEFDKRVCIYMDITTNVQYLAIHQSHGVGVTVLVDQNGKPLLYKPLEEIDS
jgi:hypothetical protein